MQILNTLFGYYLDEQEEQFIDEYTNHLLILQQSQKPQLLLLFAAPLKEILK